LLLADKKVLYINSYGKNTASYLTQIKAVQHIFNKYKYITLKSIHMNSHNIKYEKDFNVVAEKIKNYVYKWQPDIIIASDDNASNYIIKKYFKNKNIPIIFIGVNWDIKKYGYPYKNLTGQVEVEAINELVKALKIYAKGSKIGLLTADTKTDRKTLKYYQDLLGIKFEKIKFVKNFDSWIHEYKKIQKEVDILIFRKYSGIDGWDPHIAKYVVEENTTIPTGSISGKMDSLVLMNYKKDNSEFGEYAARTAVKVLNGYQINKIPITKNYRVNVSLNMTLARKLKILFPIDLLDTSLLVK
ncbi:MAG: hypothetical protein GY932_15370, partial [Arcobacter sp.]|nr:hypothetical protein [Arcobacter sp.]